MSYYVLNQNYEMIYLLENYQSVIWTERYFSAGDFEVYSKVSTDLIEYMNIGNYIVSSDSNYAMIILSKEIETDVENGDHIRITGTSLEGILRYRIVWELTTFENVDFQTAIKQLITDAFISPTDEKRKIANFIFEDTDDEFILGLTLTDQYHGADIALILENQCTTNKIGYRIWFDDDYNFVFKLYSGIDHSYNQDIRPYVVFSPEFDNIINSNYIQSEFDYRNVTLVGGEGEGASRTMFSVGDSEGLARRESYVESGEISSDADGGSLTTEEYEALLQTKGEEDLETYKSVETFDGEIEPYGVFQYREDFNIGDLVQISNAYGMGDVTRIIEIVRSDDIDGFYIIPTFQMD